MAKQVKMLTKTQALEAADMYEKVDGRGRRVWSVMRLADFYGVSETTMYRAVNRVGGYRDVPAPLPPEGSEEMQRLAAESYARLQEKLKEPAKPEKTQAEIYLETGQFKSVPVNPLDE